MAGTSNSNSFVDAEIKPHVSLDMTKTTSPSPHGPHDDMTTAAAPPSPAAGPVPSDDKMPSSEYFSVPGQRKGYVEICLPLYRAALRGDWKAANEIITKHKDVVRASITKNRDSALHIASSTKHTSFVEELLKLMKPEDLRHRNDGKNTALCLAAAAGTLDIAKLMVEKDPQLPQIRGSQNMSPLLMAALFGHKDMVSYLYPFTNHMTQSGWLDEDRIRLFHALISTELYDTAMELLSHHKRLLALEIDGNALQVLARNPLAFEVTRQPFSWKRLKSIIPGLSTGHDDKKCQALTIVQIIWGEVVQEDDKKIDEIIRGPSAPAVETGEITRGSSEESDNPPVTKYQSQLLFVAAALGNTKFLIELLQMSPELTWKVDDNERTLFHVAVLHRQVNVYNLLHEIGLTKNLLTSFEDIHGNNMLHLAAMKPSQNRLHNVSGVAFQMQMEILWFKEVESMVHFSLREAKNKDGKTPQELFTDEHAKLMEDGERWMKETAAQCMVVAALITTITFAAAFTLPGGNNSDNGHPIFKQKAVFMLFIIADAISFLSSSGSILVLLAILTSRYAERDFAMSLPRKLMIGLLALFISIMTMMIAFSASFFLIYTKGTIWVPILVCVIAAVLVVLFPTFEFRLFGDVIRTTFNSKSVFKAKKYMLY